MSPLDFSLGGQLLRQKTLELSIALFMLIIGVILTSVKPSIGFSSRGSIPAYSFYASGHFPVGNDGMANHGVRRGDNGVEFKEQPTDQVKGPYVVEQMTGDRGKSGSGATYVIYINWDGFAYRYYEWANSPSGSGTPVLNYLASRGALLTNAYNGFPGTTVPMQTSIVTGAWPAIHGNTHLYYDSAENVVKQMNRENSSETIGEVVAESGLSSASIQQFALEGRGTWPDDPRHLYVQPSGSWHTRVAEAVKILKQEAVTAGDGQEVIVPGIPRFLAIYADDLDATGHNLGMSYGFSLALNYEAWKAKLTRKLAYMDSGLGLLVDALSELGILDQTAIILTSDHGMSHFTGDTSLPDVLETLSELGYVVELLSAGEKAHPRTDIVLVGGDLSLQFYFRWDIALSEYDEIIDALKAKPYFGGYMSVNELAKAGAHPDLGSLFIWAEPPYHFSPGNLRLRVGGHHNSGDESSRQVFMLLSGAGIRQGIVVDKPVAIIDVAPTISHLLGVRQPANSMGRILEEAIAAY
jgi:predicted AlkP superfamily pyrophosphatase or phosphodiesterase